MTATLLLLIFNLIDRRFVGVVNPFNENRLLLTVVLGLLVGAAGIHPEEASPKRIDMLVKINDEANMLNGLFFIQ